MSDERLREALRSLPPPAPGDAFTAQVMARLATAPGRRRRGAAPRWAATTAAALALAAGLGWGALALAGRQRTAELRAETAALARELAALRAEAAQPAPMIYVGGNEEVDLVLDLSALPMAAAVPAPLAAAAAEERR
jgi:hypothetical protein